jgi:hypothetical protein
MEQNTAANKSNSSSATPVSSASSSGTLASQNQQRKTPDSHVRKLMLDTWSKSIFSEIKYRLQNSAMKIVYSERTGEPFDSQLVVGVRESYGNLNVIKNLFLMILTRLVILVHFDFK